MRITTKHPFQHTKNHSNYTDEQILSMITQASTMKRYVYDFLIDRLYLLEQGKRNTKLSHTYSYLSARVIKEREFTESISWDTLDNYTTKDK